MLLLGNKQKKKIFFGLCALSVGILIGQEVTFIFYRSQRSSASPRSRFTLSKKVWNNYISPSSSLQFKLHSRRGQQRQRLPQEPMNFDEKDHDPVVIAANEEELGPAGLDLIPSPLFEEEITSVLGNDFDYQDDLKFVPVPIVESNQTVETSITRTSSANTNMNFNVTTAASALNGFSNKTKNATQESGFGVRVLCWILTSPRTHEKRAIPVKNTWGRRCDKLIFMSTSVDEALESIAQPVPDGRNYLWTRTAEAFKYIYKNHLNDADWFLKADDDTYVIVENLKEFLSTRDTNTPIYYGFKFKPFVKQGYMSGGAGYVLSKGSLKKFGSNFNGENGTSSVKACKVDHGFVEDFVMGRCLERLGVKAGDSRDADGRHRFNTFAPYYYKNFYNTTPWFKQYSFYPQEEGMNCCSNTTISFHYISGTEMYVLEYLIYHVKSKVLLAPAIV